MNNTKKPTKIGIFIPTIIVTVSFSLLAILANIWVDYITSAVIGLIDIIFISIFAIISIIRRSIRYNKAHSGDSKKTKTKQMPRYLLASLGTICAAIIIACMPAERPELKIPGAIIILTISIATSYLPLLMGKINILYLFLPAIPSFLLADLSRITDKYWDAFIGFVIFILNYIIALVSHVIIYANKNQQPKQ